MVRELITFAARTINMVPSHDGVSDTLSPDTIVTGRPKPDYATMKLEFGTYVQVYDGTSNDTKSRTLGAIALNPTGNSNGDYYFLSLATGHRIHRRSWTVIPISDAAISRVEAIAFQEGMPLVDTDTMLTEYDPDTVVDDDEYDRTYLPPTGPDRESDHDLTSDAYTTESDSDGEFDDEGHHGSYDDEPAITTSSQPPQNEERLAPTMPSAPATTPSLPPSVILPQPPQNGERLDTATTAPSAPVNPPPPAMDRPTPIHPLTSSAPPPKPPQPYTLRPSRRSDYTYRYGFAQLSSGGPVPHPTPSGFPCNVNPSVVQKAILGLVFTQMSAAKGVKKHGQAAWDALKQEFQQFRQMDVFEPLDAFKLTDTQKAEALHALSVIKEKCCGKLKGRMVADGSAQRGKYSKEETGSPTIASDALFLTIMIDAYENRDVATADISGAYLHALMKDFVSLRFTGWAVDLLCEVNPDYTHHVVYEGKTKALYVRCNKAIYGCVMSGLLWYELFTSVLIAHGFQLNPYDLCIANATIAGSQCTVGWYIDDTKISHVDPTVVNNILALLEARFGKMSITRSPDHAFLGIDIHYGNDHTAYLHMPSYITEALDECNLSITKDSPTPCASSLFTVDPNSPSLPPARATTFHRIVAKLLYVSTRTRPDIVLTMSFLCGRVSAPTEQDEKKLRRLLEYLRGTQELKLHLRADSLSTFTTWVDASFATHPDMRSHTGGVISFGRGGLICKSTKQKINTKSSTEAELVGASDYLPHTLFTKLFLEAQGHPIPHALFHQDNESAIKMERNGKLSSGNHSRHIDIRYFFITDHSKRSHIDIQHCPTGAMLADFLTKPLQGSLFRKFRAVLLGHAHVSTLHSPVPATPPEERVGKPDLFGGVEKPEGDNPSFATPIPPHSLATDPEV
jgi:hypothetical protein